MRAAACEEHAQHNLAFCDKTRPPGDQVALAHLTIDAHLRVVWIVDGNDLGQGEVFSARRASSEVR